MHQNEYVYDRLDSIRLRNDYIHTLHTVYLSLIAILILRLPGCDMNNLKHLNLHTSIIFFGYLSFSQWRQANT